MQKLRWNPLLQQWVAVSTGRQNRPQMPANWCPFDPGSGKVPESYDVFLYPNDFPAFSASADPFDPSAIGLFAETGSRGACDVVLYSPKHTLPPSQLTVENWRKIVDLWTSRTSEHAANGDIAMVAVFENCGEAVGVTMPHPHGQIYAMPFVSPTLERELVSSRQFAELNDGRCLFCELLQRELQDTRIVCENQHFAAFVPFAARFPAEICVCAKRHCRSLIDLSEEEKDALASIVSTIRKKYANLPLAHTISAASTKFNQIEVSGHH